LIGTDKQPDITFFGQALDFEFDECLFKDREKVDLLVVIGTSLKVAPVSEVLGELHLLLVNGDFS
jgi:NAD-dependent histone deacetylase SIR2